jgi:pentatricopeptide repeat protein
MCDGVVMVLCKLVCHFKGVTLNSRRYLTTNANTICISSPTSKTSCGTGCYNASRRFGEEENSTYALVLQRCMDSKGVSETKAVQAHMIKAGFYPNVYLQTNLLIAYARWNCVEYARQVFDEMPQRDLVSWNAMLTGYARHGNGERALTVFYEMHQTCIRMDHFTFGSVFRACASLVAIDQGKQLQGFAIKLGLESDVFVGTALVDFYAKCETRMENARQVFDRMYHRNVVSWSAMIAGYVHHGCGGETLRLLHLMQLEGVKPNEITFTSVVNACANVAALEQGKQVHASIIGNGYVYYDKLANALVDMYSKCGKLEYARQMFDKMPQRDVVSWTTIITAYGKQGHGKEVVKLFEQMQMAGIRPNHVTFLTVLSACSHAGLVKEGLHYFNSMSQDNNNSISPTAEHYACVVDLLGRAGCLVEAYDVISKIPFEPTADIWGSLLGASRIHGNIELGECAAAHLFELDPQNAGHYVLLANIYAAAGKWDGVAMVRKTMKDRGIKKVPGCSWIEVNKMTHVFSTGDRSHPKSEEIYAVLQNLGTEMKELGYVVDTNFELHDVEQQHKEYALCYHSEKLAIAFGLISTPPGTPIRIIKNLRMCGDCHRATKFISNISGREVVVRDSTRFHSFESGLCSCGDYW